MPAPKMPRLSVPVDDLLELIEQFDTWGGTMPPDQAATHRLRFRDLRRRAQQLLDRHPTENEAYSVSS